jgi:hypothetical protein
MKESPGRVMGFWTIAFSPAVQHVRPAVRSRKRCEASCAEDCLKLARETDEIYAKMALIEMATEFRVMAEHLEHDAARRTATHQLC